MHLIFTYKLLETDKATSSHIYWGKNLPRTHIERNVDSILDMATCQLYIEFMRNKRAKYKCFINYQALITC